MYSLKKDVYFGIVVHVGGVHVIHYCFGVVVIRVRMSGFVLRFVGSEGFCSI